MAGLQPTVLGQMSQVLGAAISVQIGLWLLFVERLSHRYIEPFTVDEIF